MKFFSDFLKRIKDKIGFKIMTKEEYELFLRKKRMGHNSNFLMNDINTNDPSFFNGVNINNSSSIHHKINPATGLPTSNGIDVGGNPYGVDLSNSFDHSFQDLGNSYHNDFHHN